MSEELPEKLAAQLSHLKDRTITGSIGREDMVEKMDSLIRNAFNLGKNPDYELTPIE